MNTLTLHLYNALPDAPAQNAGFVILENVGDQYAQQWKKLPNGRTLARYTNNTGIMVTAVNGSNGINHLPFCIPQYLKPCPNDAGPALPISPNQSVFVLQELALGRWVPVRPQDESLIFSPAFLSAAINPLSTANSANLSETSFADLTNTTGFKVAALAAILFIGYKIFK